MIKSTNLNFYSYFGPDCFQSKTVEVEDNEVFMLNILFVKLNLFINSINISQRNMKEILTDSKKD